MWWKTFFFQLCRVVRKASSASVQPVHSGLVPSAVSSWGPWSQRIQEFKATVTGLLFLFFLSCNQEHRLSFKFLLKLITHIAFCKFLTFAYNSNKKHLLPTRGSFWMSGKFVTRILVVNLFIYNNVLCIWAFFGRFLGHKGHVNSNHKEMNTKSAVTVENVWEKKERSMMSNPSSCLHNLWGPGTFCPTCSALSVLHCVTVL